MAQVWTNISILDEKLTEPQFKAAFLCLVALFTSYAFAVAPLVVKGSDFVNSIDDTRFQIIGVA